jgi:hypothetical protein
MDYRNISRVCLFDKAIAKYNKSSDTKLHLTHVQILYALHWLTRNKPVAPTGDIRILVISFRRTKVSHFHILKLLRSLEDSHIVSCQTLERGFLLWSLTITGHNALKWIERRIRKERSDHRMSTTLVMPHDL